MTTADYILKGSPTISYQAAESATPVSITALAGMVHQRQENEYVVYSTLFSITDTDATGVSNPTISDTLIDNNGITWGVVGIETDDWSGLHTLMCERKALITRHRQ